VEIAAYVDGVVTSSSGTILDITAGDAPYGLLFGNNTNGDLSGMLGYYQGYIQEIAMFNYRLTTTQITNLVTAGPTYFDVEKSLGPIDAWHLDESSGSILNDWAGSIPMHIYGSVVLGQPSILP